MAVYIESQSLEIWKEDQKLALMIGRIITWRLDCESEEGLEELAASVVILPENSEEMVRKLSLQN